MKIIDCTMHIAPVVRLVNMPGVPRLGIKDAFPPPDPLA